MNKLQILLAFGSMLSIVTKEVNRKVFSGDHHKFIDTMNNLMRNYKISMKDPMITKRFEIDEVKGREQV